MAALGHFWIFLWELTRSYAWEQRLSRCLSRYPSEVHVPSEGSQNALFFMNYLNLVYLHVCSIITIFVKSKCMWKSVAEVYHEIKCGLWEWQENYTATSWISEWGALFHYIRTEKIRQKMRQAASPHLRALRTNLLMFGPQVISQQLGKGFWAMIEINKLWTRSIFLQLKNNLIKRATNFCFRISYSLCH